MKPKYTPAITIVEGCNNAGIGVGADIACDNRLKKGNWADLEKIITIIGNNNKGEPKHNINLKIVCE